MEISRRAVILSSLYLALAMSYCCAQETGASCQILYTEQPPDFLPCNPYLSRELRLECTVESPLQTSLRVEVAWFYNPDPLQRSLCYANELQNTERKISILRQENFFSDRRNVRSQLRVFNLTDLDSGTYWCTVRANGLQQLLPSDPVFLEQSVIYEDAALPACSTVSAVSKEENKCAIFPASVLPQISPSCSISSPTPQLSTALLQLTASPLRPTASLVMQPMVMVLPTSIATPLNSEVPPQSRQVMLTSSEFVRSMATTSSSAAAQPSMRVDVMPSAVIPEVTASVANNGPTDGPSLEPRTPLSDPPPFLPQLYIGIGVIVLLGVIITVLLSIFICLCLRSHRLKVSKADRHMESNAYCDSNRSRSCSRTPLRQHNFDSVRSNSSRSTQITNGSVLLNIHCRLESESSNDINSVTRIPVSRNFENSNSIDHSYETVLSNEYEDVIEVRENRAYTGSPVHVKRNRAYRAFAVDEESATLAADEPQEPVSIQRPQDYILPHPTHLNWTAASV